jgi:predicted glycoside hydrolase/deacetylase ChbG (UPF0249 family)
MIILNADDYGLSEGVSRGILELCGARRVSATSAIVTLDRWHGDAAHLLSVRSTTAIGLHLNLTLGRPLITRPHAHDLNTEGRLLSIRQLAQRALLGIVDQHAVQAECHAQIMAFRSAVGHLPDFIDGHQHAHVLPKIRHALLAAIANFTWLKPPMIRVPSDRHARSGAYRDEWVKRTVITQLCRGFRKTLEDARLPTNETFAGFSSFNLGHDYGAELGRALDGGGRCHIVMCHPGYGDTELAASGDPVVERRGEELAGIMSIDGLSERIWHPVREANGAIDWAEAMTT